MAKNMQSTDSKSDVTTSKTTTTQAKTPAVAAGGAAADVENHGSKEPVGDSDMAGDIMPGQQMKDKEEDEQIQ